jgi:hypothetical protein
MGKIGLSLERSQKYFQLGQNKFTARVGMYTNLTRMCKPVCHEGTKSSARPVVQHIFANIGQFQTIAPEGAIIYLLHTIRNKRHSIEILICDSSSVLLHDPSIPVLGKVNYCNSPFKKSTGYR